MKTTATSLLLLMCFFFAAAQKMERYYDWNWKPSEAYAARYVAVIKKQDSVWHRQNFFIHEQRLQRDGFYKDEDTKIEHGVFRTFYPNGQLESTGHYNNGEREGVWLSYYSNGMIKDSAAYRNGSVVGVRLGWHSNGIPADSSFFYTDGSGTSIHWFDNGNPSSAGAYSVGGKFHGKWKYFHKNGQPSAVEVYQYGNLQSTQYFDESGAPLPQATIKDREAAFPGGDEAWQKYLQKRLYFPSHLQFSNVREAVVVVQWAIDEAGNVMDVEVIVPLHPEFDRIALDAIRKSPKWEPAISHNRSVKAYRRQAVTFYQ